MTDGAAAGDAGAGGTIAGAGAASGGAARSTAGAVGAITDGCAIGTGADGAMKEVAAVGAWAAGGPTEAGFAAAGDGMVRWIGIGASGGGGASFAGGAAGAAGAPMDETFDAGGTTILSGAGCTAAGATGPGATGRISLVSGTRFTTPQFGHLPRRPAKRAGTASRSPQVPQAKRISDTASAPADTGRGATEVPVISSLFIHAPIHRGRTIPQAALPLLRRHRPLVVL